MPQSYNDEIEPGSFVPTTGVFDPQLIQELDINSQTFKEFLVRIQQSINNIALVLNSKDSAIYDTSMFVNGQLFFPNPTVATSANPASSTIPFRQVFRTVVNFGVLPNTGTTSIAHNIANIGTTFSFTRIYACATKPTAPFSFIPIPYVSVNPAGEDIELRVDATNVTIVTQSDRSAYTICYVIIEWISD